MDSLVEQLTFMIEQWRQDSAVTKNLLNEEDSYQCQRMIMLADSQLICAEEVEAILSEWADVGEEE